jgi:hypothetical protein
MILCFANTTDRLYSGNNNAPSASIQSIDDNISDPGEVTKLNKTQPTANVKHFFKWAPQVRGAKTRWAMSRVDWRVSGVIQDDNSI